MYREPSKLPKHLLNPARSVSKKGLDKTFRSLEEAVRKDPKAVREILGEVNKPSSRRAVVATGRVSSAPASKETSMAKRATKGAGKRTGKGKNKGGRKAAPAAAKPAKKRGRRRLRTPAPTASKKRLMGVRKAVVRAARAIAPKKLKRVKRANLPRGQYMSRKGMWRQVNPTTDTKLMIAKVASFGVGLVLAEGLDRYLATRKTDKTKELYGVAAAKAIRSRPDGVRMFAQAAGAGVFGLGAYLLRKKSAYATSVLGGMAAAFGVKLFLQVVVDHALPALLKAKSSNEETFGNRILPDRQAYMDESVPGSTGRRPFSGNPAHPAGSVGTARVPLSLGEVFPGVVGCGGGCSKCGSRKPCACQGSSCGDTRVPVGVDFGGPRASEVFDNPTDIVVTEEGGGGGNGRREGGGGTVPTPRPSFVPSGGGGRLPVTTERPRSYLDVSRMRSKGQFYTPPGIR